jgi:hypothetical protein
MKLDNKNGLYFSVCGERATNVSHCGLLELKQCPQKKHEYHPTCLNTGYSNGHINRIVVTQTCLLDRTASKTKSCTVMGIRQARNILRNANSKQKY